ncbi:MAG TPA: ribonucleotide reductase N-terminal alpha domain-containing protein, partial [Tissierellaceae bacterium]|nr:ribonucleotide reductase N-terminal alpha domain-containing protein [Tissierellaceae bacterium]
MFEQAISKEIFEKKYCIHGETSVEEVFTGVAEEIASCEDEPHIWQDVFYEEMIEGKFLPAGRILANARLDSPMKNYMNCYVIPVTDSMEGIYTALKNDALIGKMGGGVGFNISNLRPKNASISKGGESSGPMSFLDIFDVSAKAIHTGGARRSAHICIMDVSHPDIEEFVTYKKSNGKLTQFNISVGITDAFMLAVKYDMDWDLQFGGKVYKTVKARYLYDLITENMYEHNEPGVFFLDTVNDNNSGSYMYNINSPNPCGEEPLPDFGCCCLGALNLSAFVKEPFTDKASFDYGEFIQSIHRAVRFLDNVLSTSDYPIPEIRKQVLSERRIGLGFTALADTFTMMGMVYGSIESLRLSVLIGETLRNESYLASIELAIEKDTFPNYKHEILECGFVSKLPEYIKEK